MKYRTILFVLSLFLSCRSLYAADASFAIVADPLTVQKLRQELASYAKVIEARGLTPILLIDRWQHPDSIRFYLQKLYVEQQLEGAVFIGDIPVPMVRDAQHLTTAFKMDQNRNWKESSVPSDRFYDDFDLRFDYIQQDSTERLYHYYSLRADAPQQIHCTIYTARIKPPQIPGQDKYQAIGAFLNKISAFYPKDPPLNKLLYFAGQGYNSNCMIARIDEKYALQEQFPALSTLSNNIQYIDHTFDEYVKFRLLAALQNPDLGLAILHHHGDDDRQLLSGSPKASEANKWIALARDFFRSKIRSAKDTTQAKQYYLDNYKIPAYWLDDAFDPIQITVDSLNKASMDVNIPDLYGYVSQAKVIILDACFNGSFHLDDYIAGYYIFNPGQTMVVKANSVNTLQDTWTNQLIELLPMGARIGLWAKGQMTLESHLLGDPTFAFAPTSYPVPLTPENLNRALAFETKDPNFWRPLLTARGDRSTLGLRTLAIKRLQEMNALSADELIAIQSTDPMAIVRLQAFTQLVAIADENLPQGILLGMQDAYELTRRLATLYASKNGSPALLPAIAANTLDPATTARVKFQNQYAAEQYRSSEYIAALQTALPKNPSVWVTPEKLATLIRTTHRSDSLDAVDFKNLFDPQKSIRSKQFTLSGLRNSCNPLYLDLLFDFLRRDTDPLLRLQLAEALGWYRYSYYKPEIQKQIGQILPAEKDPVVAKELQKTLNRLE